MKAFILFFLLINLDAKARDTVSNKQTVEKHIVIESLTVNAKELSWENLRELFGSNVRVISFDEKTNRFKRKLKNISLDISFAETDSLYFFLPIDRKSSKLKILLGNEVDTLRIKSWEVFNNCLSDTLAGSITYYQYENGKMLEDKPIIESKSYHRLTKSDCKQKKKAIIIINEKQYHFILTERDGEEIGWYHGYKSQKDSYTAENLDSLMTANPTKIFRYVKFAAKEIVKERCYFGYIELK